MTPRDRRALVLGGGAIIGAVLVFRLLPWAARSVTALRAEAVERVETLARADDVLAGTATVRDSLARALNAVVGLAPRLVDGRTAAEAQASLSGLVSLAASRHAIRVARLDPVSDSAAGVFRRVAVHAELEGDITGLTRFLKEVETGDPLLTVLALAVQSAEQLRIEATVAGLYLPRGESK